MNRDILREARSAGLEIARLKRVRQVYLDMATSIGVNNDSEVHVSDPANSKVANAALKMADISGQLTQQIVTSYVVISLAVDLIGRVKQPQYRDLLTRRYVLLENWKEIMSAVGYTEERNMFRAHSQALAQIDKLTID